MTSGFLDIKTHEIEIFISKNLNFYTMYFQTEMNALIFGNSLLNYDLNEV